MTVRKLSAFTHALFCRRSVTFGGQGARNTGISRCLSALRLPTIICGSEDCTCGWSQAMATCVRQQRLFQCGKARRTADTFLAINTLPFLPP